MDDLKDLTFEEMLKKMNELQQIELNWKENKNPSQLRQSVKNLEISELDALVEQIDDPGLVVKVVQLYFYKFFALINMKVKDLLMRYKDDPSKLMELQGELQKIFSFDIGSMNMGDMFGNSNDSMDLDDSMGDDIKSSTTPKNKKLN